MFQVRWRQGSRGGVEEASAVRDAPVIFLNNSKYVSSAPLRDLRKRPMRLRMRLAPATHGRRKNAKIKKKRRCATKIGK